MKFIYLIYQICIALPIMLAATIIAAIVCIIGCIFDNRFWGYWPGMIWGRLFCYVFLIPVHVHGKENIRPGQSYVIVANHQSFFDIFALYGHIGIRFKWLMKQEIDRIPFVGWACRAAGHICIDRASAMHSYKSLDKAKRQLSDGMSVIIFPEGTRTPDGQVHKFKRGSFQIAADLQLPVLPVTINGCYRVMSRHDWHVNRHAIDIRILEPLDMTCNGNTDDAASRGALLRQAAEAAQQSIASALVSDSADVAGDSRIHQEVIGS